MRLLNFDNKLRTISNSNNNKYPELDTIFSRIDTYWKVKGDDVILL